VSGGELSRDRLALWGSVEAVVPLVRDVLPEVAPSYRCLGSPDLVKAVASAVPEMTRRAEFGWMELRGPAPDGAGATRWLDDEELPEATALLDEGFPHSFARPGDLDVNGWAGVRDPATGRLAALSCLAWSAPTVAMLAGVAVAPWARGRGYGRQVCAFGTAEAIRGYGAAVLMVEKDNAPAIGLYRSLGMDWHDLSLAASPEGGPARRPTRQVPHPAGRRAA
jgi:GNAT superfamily N-acetyltransferase